MYQHEKGKIFFFLKRTEKYLPKALLLMPYAFVVFLELNFIHGGCVFTKSESDSDLPLPTISWLNIFMKLRRVYC